MRIGASVWPFQWNHPYEDALRRISGLGFRSVELIAWRPNVLEEYYTPQRIRELRSIMDGEGLVLSEFVSNASAMASPLAEERDALVEYFKRFCAVARELGTGMVNTVAPVPFKLTLPHLKTLPVTQ